MRHAVLAMLGLLLLFACSSPTGEPTQPISYDQADSRYAPSLEQAMEIFKDHEEEEEKYEHASSFMAFSPYPLEGYASGPSVAQGAKLDFFVSTEESTYDMEFLRIGATEQSLMTVTGLPGGLQPVPANILQTGCGWQLSYRLSVPKQWLPGLYVARLKPPAGSSNPPHNIEFIVKEDQLGSFSKILTLSPDFTAQAYNGWGGASLYYSPYGAKVPMVTLHRPQDAQTPGGLIDKQWGSDFIGYLEEKELVLEFASELDLHSDPGLLDHYELLLLFGHHEYFTLEMREAVDAFVGNGGRLLVLTANTGYWQIRFEDGHAIRCHKNPKDDPWYGSLDQDEAARITTQFAMPPVMDPEDRTFGSGWRNASWGASYSANPLCPGGFLGGDYPCYRVSEGYGYYRVLAPEHPAFEGMDLQTGDKVGCREIIYQGYPINQVAAFGEVNGPNKERISDRILTSETSGAPRNLLSLADAPSIEGFCTFSSHDNLGTVVNCGSGGYVRCLTLPDHPFVEMDTVTLNLLDHLSRPCRNLLRNGGFERWEMLQPTAFEVLGPVLEETESVVGGVKALNIPMGYLVTLRQTLEDLEGNQRYHLVLYAQASGNGASVAFKEAFSGVPLCSVNIEPGPGRYYYATCVVPAGSFYGTVEIRTNGTTSLILDNLEVIPETLWQQEVCRAKVKTSPRVSSPQGKPRGGSPAAASGFHKNQASEALPSLPGFNETPPLGFVEGGNRYLVTGQAMVSQGTGYLQIVDWQSGQVIAEEAITQTGMQPFYFVAHDENRGQMRGIRFQSKAGPQTQVSVKNLEILPLRVSSPAQPIRPANGDFETVHPDGELPYWSLSGPGSAGQQSGAHLAGTGCLFLDATAGRTLLEQSLETISAPGRFLLSAWILSATGNSRVHLRDLDSGDVLLTLSPSVTGTWEAVQGEISLDADHLENGLKIEIEGMQNEVLLLDCLRFRSTEEVLVEDHFSNGGFELCPTEAEVSPDWRGEFPHWAIDPPGTASLDNDFSYAGLTSMKMAAGTDTAVTYSPTSDFLPIDRPWRLRLKGYASAGASIRVTLKAVPPHSQNLVELGSTVSVLHNTWEDLAISIPPNLLSALQERRAAHAYVIIEASNGTVWVDNLTLEVDA